MRTTKERRYDEYGEVYHKTRNKKGPFDQAIKSAPNSTIARRVMIWDNQNFKDTFVGERQLDDPLFGEKRHVYLRNYRNFLKELRRSSKNLWIPYSSYKKYLVYAGVLLLLFITFLIFGALAIYFEWYLWVIILFFVLAFIAFVLAVGSIFLWNNKKTNYLNRLEDRERQFSMVCHDFNTGPAFTNANMEINTGRYGAFLVVILRDHLGADVNIRNTERISRRKEMSRIRNEESYISYNADADQSFVSHDVRDNYYDSRPYYNPLPMESYRV